MNVPENAGQDWINSEKVYKNVVLANPENKSLIGREIDFEYRRVDFFKLSQPLCDLGNIGLDQISTFRIVFDSE